ncbi:MAG: class I SAM-dependent methyltransferase [Frankiales bacterium]|nr:class I SAM-dependent methyltransferase [Frankiales bacterium]
MSEGSGGSTVERSAHEWDESYRRDEPPPWDIGRPQPMFLELAEQGRFSGRLLDAGCGTGEHTLLAAAKGADAFGVDLSSTAIDAARAKAAARGLAARFESGDLLTMELPAGGFATALDSGVFHVFDDVSRARYVGVLADALRPEGRLYLMCFSDRQPGDWGPRRVSEAELRDAFASGWEIERLERALFDINPMPEASDVQAWLLVARRTAD